MNTFVWLCFIVAVGLLVAWYYEHRLHAVETLRVEGMKQNVALRNDLAGTVKSYERLLEIHETVVVEHAECPTHVLVERLNRDLLTVQAEHSECPVPYVLADHLQAGDAVSLDAWRGKRATEHSDFDWLDQAQPPIGLVDHTVTD